MDSIYDPLDEDTISMRGSDKSDRRNNKLRFDKSITLGTIISLISICYAIYTGVESIKTDFRVTNQRVIIMWEHFKREHADVSLYEKELGDAGSAKY